MLLISRCQNDRNKFLVQCSSIVEMLVNHMTFPSNAMSDVRLFFSHDPTIVRLRTNHEYILGITNFLFCPSWPSFRRRRFILIKPAINPIVAQAVCKVQNLIFVLGGVVAVADENYEWLRRFRHGKPRPRAAGQNTRQGLSEYFSCGARP